MKGSELEIGALYDTDAGTVRILEKGIAASSRPDGRSHRDCARVEVAESRYSRWTVGDTLVLPYRNLRPVRPVHKDNPT